MSATSSRSPTNRPNNIVLIGFMGSGKSSVGKELADRLGWELVDTDALIEAKTCRRIADVFAEDGEPAFRDLEGVAVREASERVGVVVSVGGGAVLRAENIAALRKGGMLFLLDATPEAIYERVAHEKHRPLLDVPDPVGRIHELMDARRPYYGQADVVVDTTCRPVAEIVDELLMRYRTGESTE